MRPIYVLSVGLMHSQIEVAAADVWVPQKWMCFKAIAALCVSNVPFYLMKGWREKAIFCKLYDCHSKEHASTCGHRDSVIIFCGESQADELRVLLQSPCI